MLAARHRSKHFEDVACPQSQKASHLFVIQSIGAFGTSTTFVNREHLLDAVNGDPINRLKVGKRDCCEKENPLQWDGFASQCVHFAHSLSDANSVPTVELADNIEGVCRKFHLRWMEPDWLVDVKSLRSIQSCVTKHYHGDLTMSTPQIRNT